MSVPKKQDGWRPGTAQDLETMYHFKERFRELKKLLDLVESGKLDMKTFFTDSGNANFRNGLQYSGSPTKPLYMAVWDADDSADGTQPNRRVRSIEAEGARALMGAAPAGYGYGGQAVALKGNSLITSEEELNTELAKVYDSMASGETKMITWIQYPLSSDWRWFGMLSKSSANNGSLTAHSAYGGGSNIIKTKNSGIWRTVEWENPPMLPGTEYRTTERWDNKPVYRKLVKHTNETVISGGTLYQIEHGISNMDRNYGVQISARTVGYQLPYIATEESTAVTGCTATKIEMWATGATSWSAGRTWYFDMKYVKSE